MSRVEIAGQAWGVLQDHSGTGQSSITVTITTLAALTAPTYTTATGSTAASKVTDSNGRIPGFIEEGTYTASYSSGGTTASYTVEAVSGRPAARVYLGGIADDSTDNTATWLANYAAASSGSTFVLPAGTFRGTLPAISVDDVTIQGAGERKTIIKPPATMSSGYVLDVTANFFTLEGVTIQGGADATTAIATGSAGGIRLRGGSSRHLFRNVEVLWFLTTGYGLAIQGSQSNEFYGLAVEGCNLNMIVMDSTDHVSSGNQNVFYSPKIQRAQLAAGPAIEIRDADGTVFHGGLVQGNKGLKTLLITNTSLGNGSGRANSFVGVWFEENGNSQASSHGIHVEGYDSSHLIVNTRIADCQLISSNHDNPTSQIYLTNADATIIRGNYSNLGTPNKAVEYGAGTKRTRVVNNKFAGDFSGAEATTSVASTAVLALPEADVATVTGTADITSIATASTWGGRRVVLMFTGTAATNGVVDNGTTMNLAGGNFAYTPNDILELVCADGTNWLEVGRSAN